MKNKDRKIIGIVGGMGPFAGLDLNQKIFEYTATRVEQDHLEVYLLSSSSLIPDRTEFLLNPDRIENPGKAVYRVIEKLSRIGAEIIGIPCNTSHSPRIFNCILENIENNGLSVTLLNMIRETHDFLRIAHPGVERVGLLATKGTYFSGVYTHVFASAGEVEVMNPSPSEQETVHACIYDSGFGIKNHPNPLRKEAVDGLAGVARSLIAAGAQAIVMGCTEIPLALRPVSLTVPRIDTTAILARALIARADPTVLRKQD
ncbi:MAG TPA: amino acid racemase [Spirochaetia bacterium]|nr:amino acid racemase [Spirochaetia bacterium]